jgi:hypothetical protein
LHESHCREWRDPPLQPKTAFSCFPLVHRADLERQQRVERARSQLVSGTVAPVRIPSVLRNQPGSVLVEDKRRRYFT